jgi:hypothetical protein
MLLSSRSQGALAAYSRSEEDLIQRLPDLSLNGGGGANSGSAVMGRVSLPPPVLRNLVRERLRQDGISLSAHPYTQAVSCTTQYRCTPLICKLC